jgi:hypothetical protein
MLRDFRHGDLMHVNEKRCACNTMYISWFHCTVISTNWRFIRLLIKYVMSCMATSHVTLRSRTWICQWQPIEWNAFSSTFDENRGMQMIGLFVKCVYGFLPSIQSGWRQKCNRQFPTSIQSVLKANGLAVFWFVQTILLTGTVSYLIRSVRVKANVFAVSYLIQSVLKLTDWQQYCGSVSKLNHPVLSLTSSFIP